MIYTLLVLVVCFTVYSVYDMYLDRKSLELSTKEYLLLGHGSGKLIVIFFMLSMCYQLIAKPEFLFQQIPQTLSNVDSGGTIAADSVEVSELLKQINNNIQHTNTLLQVAPTSNSWGWVVVILLLAIAILALWGHIKKKIGRALFLLIFFSALSLVVTFNLVNVEQITPKIVFYEKSENIQFNYVPDITRNSEIASPNATTRALELITTVGPFKEGKAYIKDIDKKVQGALDRINKKNIRIEHFILVGVVDKRPLKSSVQIGLKADKELAYERASKVEKTLRELINQVTYQRHKQAKISILPYGPNNISSLTDEENLASDRRVDVYIGYSEILRDSPVLSK